jgi:hypothetical protein
MMRSELKRMLVLNEISDDYEEPQHIHERLAPLAEQCRMPITPEDVRQALIDLVQAGWAKAYPLAMGEKGEEIRDAIQGLPPERVGEHYYWITDEGRKIQNAFTGFPFDDRGAMIPGWCPPAE